MAEFDFYNEEFRDSIATVDKEGKRIWIYPKKPKGKFYNYRNLLAYFYIALFLVLPFIKIKGQPFILLNILERKFVLFGVYFMPQDFYLFAIAMLILMVFIILFTVIYGRLFCGWICPQTIFMELVFRRIEYWIEGDYKDQKRLNDAPLEGSKIYKKLLKHTLFLAISIVISNYFLAYIIGMDEVLKIISEPVSLHLGGFVAMIIFSFVFYGVFARLREQVCTTICPYGRLQGVLLDQKSLVVAYDYVRGEPRGKITKDSKTFVSEKIQSSPAAYETIPLEKVSENSATDATSIFQKNLKGDCVDCKLCIHVCPTGIDIRNGTQLECVNCTACMDACDEVMEKVKRPTGLIRIDSIEGIEKGKRNVWNGRVLAYTVVLVLLIALEILLFSVRGSIEVLLLRTPGLTAIEKKEGYISNLYNYTMINKTPDNIIARFRLSNSNGIIEMVGKEEVTVIQSKKSSGSLFLHFPKNQVDPGKNNVIVEVIDKEGKVIETVKTTFFGPPR
ncbi:MAG: 4Fe-4S binding protein [Saprospiraceae bacterium]|nr:4Fe-4S binding protein [Saprospiraceae bacterium]MBK8854504.1 4Fe-4S binding protein [Saprospiraceae bacterium]MBK9044540.1 4Fe-4S binding protein [Saprospiraceae bacterium]